MRESGGCAVTRYNVCHIACKVYSSTLSVQNIQSAFKKCGIFPFNRHAVSDSQVAPATTFDRDYEPSERSATTTDMADAKDFLQERGGKILQNVQRAAKKRNTLSRVVGGTAITEDAIVKQIKTHNEKYAPKSKVQRKCENKENNLRPSTSGVVAKSSARCKPKKTDLPAEDNSDSSDNDIADSEKCIVCNRYSPDTRNFPYIMIVKWGQCDLCKGWVHLIFCSPVRVIRRGDTFKCPSCTSKI